MSLTGVYCQKISQNIDLPIPQNILNVKSIHSTVYEKDILARCWSNELQNIENIYSLYHQFSFQYCMACSSTF